METDRRTLLVALAALGVGAAGLASPAEAGHLGFRLASGARRADGGFAVLGVEPDGAVAFEIPLPGRAHGIACRPVEREAVVMARRPGSFAVVFDGADGTVRRLLAAPDGRSFYGHALYAPDGGLLYTTERADDGEDGVLGVWDARDGYARVGELSTGGIGPHDLAGLSGGRIVVANGGILTDPRTGRAKLNLDTMAPSLAVLDGRTGAVQWQGALPPSMHQLSIRHVAVAGDGTVVFGMQYEGPASDLVPLVGTASPDGRLRVLDAPDGLLGRLRNYCGDVAVDRSGRIAAASFPRGGRTCLWSIADGRLLGSVAARDGAGLAADPLPDGPPGRFWLSDGGGGIAHVEVPGGIATVASRMPFGGIAWDNHMTVIDPAV